MNDYINNISFFLSYLLNQCYAHLIKHFYIQGKSSLLNSFLDKTDPPRETLVLEYSFGRKSNQKQGIEKTICHIWEYGGKLDALMNVLPSIPITGNFYFIIMIDLSKIKRIWNTIETCFQAIKDTHPESGKRPEIIIIGGKHDIFKNYGEEYPRSRKSVKPTLCCN